MAQDTFVTPTIQASGTTWAQLKTGGLKLLLDKLAAANVAKANPTVAATNAGSVATGGLPAGTYFSCYTWVDAFGETTIGTSRSTQFTGTGLAQLLTITIPALPTGVQFANIYLTPTNGAAGTEQLYATGVTTTTCPCTGTPKVDSQVGIPGANTTGWPNQTSDFFALANGNAEMFLISLNEFISQMLQGAPVSEREVRLELIRRTGVLKAWYTAMNELSTLAWTNLGSVGYSTPVGIGISKPVRTLA